VIAPEYRAHFEELVRDPSVCHVILSNCGEARFVELGSLFPTIALARAYSAAGGPVLRLRTGSQDTHSPEQVRALLETGRILRKPSPTPFRLVVQAMGVDPEAALMVGDQHLTDVAGANRAGIRSVKVGTYRPDSFPRILRAGQVLERVLVRGP
jgi:hypothetical protein